MLADRSFKLVPLTVQKARGFPVKPLENPALESVPARGDPGTCSEGKGDVKKQCPGFSPTFTRTGMCDCACALTLGCSEEKSPVVLQISAGNAQFS